MNHRTPLFAGLVAAFLAAQACPVQALLLASPALSPWQQERISPAQGQVDAGVKALHANDLGAAEAAFRQAAKFDSALATAYIGLAEVAGRQNKLTQVEAWLQKALAADPASAYTQIVWGHYQFQRRQFGKAEAIYKKAIELDANSADARIYLAENYLRGLNKPKLAEEGFRAALALDARSGPAHLGLAAALAVQRRFDDAVAVYEQAATLAPKDPRPTHLLARLYASQGKFDQALAALQRCNTIDPSYLPAHVDRGDLYLGKNDLDNAAAAYRTGAQASQQPAMAYFKLGTVLEGQQRWVEAEQAYLAAVKDDPLMFGAYNNLAFMAAARKEHLDEALVWARKATDMAPTVTTLLDTLGWVYYARGELGPASRAIEKAVASHPKKASFRYHLGVVYAEQGKQQEAVAMLKKALSLDKHFYKADDARRLLLHMSSK